MNICPVWNKKIKIEKQEKLKLSEEEIEKKLDEL